MTPAVNLLHFGFGVRIISAPDSRCAERTFCSKYRHKTDTTLTEGFRHNVAFKIMAQKSFSVDIQFYGSEFHSSKPWVLDVLLDYIITSTTVEKVH
jgi:hypothetical protein